MEQLDTTTVCKSTEAAESVEASDSIEIIADVQVDAIGLNCPLPLLKAKQGLNKLAAGQVLALVCTDPGSVRDFEVFARQSGHKLLRSIERDGQYHYWLEKKP